MTITADTLVGSIDPESMLQSSEKAVFLPGPPERADGVKNKISFSQERTLALFVKQNFDATTTWADAIAQLRVSAGLSPKQFDFGLVQYVTDVWSTETQYDVISGRAASMLATNVAALTGEKPHWDPKIAQRIKARGPKIAQTMLERLVSVTTRGELDVAMTMMNALYGVPERPAPADLPPAGALNPDGSVDPVVDPAGDDGEEPY